MRISKGDYECLAHKHRLFLTPVENKDFTFGNSFIWEVVKVSKYGELLLNTEVVV